MLPRGTQHPRQRSPARHRSPARTHPRGAVPFFPQDGSVFGLADRPTSCAFPADLPPVASRSQRPGAAFVPAHRCGAAPDLHRTSRHPSWAPETTRCCAPS